MGTEMSEKEHKVLSVKDKGDDVHSNGIGHKDDDDVLSNGVKHDLLSNGIGNKSDLSNQEDVEESYVLVSVDLGEGGDDEAPLAVSKPESLPFDSNGAAEIQLNGVEGIDSFQDTDTAADRISSDVQDASPKLEAEESIELEVDGDSHVAEINKENGHETHDTVSLPTTDQSSCGVEDAGSEELNEKSLDHQDSTPAEIEENGGKTDDALSLPTTDQPSCGVEDASPETGLEDSHEQSLDHEDSNLAEIKQNGAETHDSLSLLTANQRSCGVEDAISDMGLEELNEKSLDHHDSNPIVTEKHGAKTDDPKRDQPSCGVEDASRETSLEESNGKNLDHQDSTPAEIEKVGAKTHDVFPLPTPDQPSCGIEDVIPCSEELNEKSLYNQDSNPAEIKGNGAKTNDASSLPMTDQSSCGIEDASPETGSDESNEKSFEHHDAMLLATEDQPPCGVEGMCPEAGSNEKSLDQHVETNDAVSLPTTDHPSSAVEDASPELDEKCLGHCDTYPVEAEKTNDATVFLPPSDLPSCVVEDVTNMEESDGKSVDRLDSCSAEIENEDESPKTGPEKIEENDATSKPDTTGGPIANVSSDEANARPDVNASVNHAISSPDSQVDDDVDKACDDQTGSRVGVEPEACQEGALEGQNAGVDVAENPPFYYLIKIPRCDDDILREGIKLAEGQVQERTKDRDAIRLKIQPQRVRAKEYVDKVQAAVAEERAARDVFKSKRQEVDSAQSVINKLKSALSVEDIGVSIRNMEHMIQHETMPLKEEKQIIREIKQLKQQREQICSSLGTLDEIQQTTDRKDQVEEQLKGLKKELDALRVSLAKAEEVTQAAKRESNKENEKLNELLYQFKNADGVRQEAYAHFHSLKKQQYEKNKYFWSYKDDSKAAEKLALSGDKEQLQRLCVDQVERVMELWNRDDTFRTEYVSRNVRSTLRRLRTSDGRALGPDEVPPVIPGRAPTSAPIPKQEKETVSVKAEKVDGDGEKPVAVTKKHAAAAVTETVLTEVKAEDKANEEAEMRAKKEEEEKIRKAAEEKRKAEEAEEAVRLKEQAKLEEKVKAKEAIERKKRNAEKARVRAALRAQKEAQEKEKEREKRARKKERKKASTGNDGNEVAEDDQNTANDNVDVSDSASNAPNNEAINETATSVKSRTRAMTVHKVKTKAVMPAPLRNRSKRRKQWWMLPLAIGILLLFALFFFFKPHLLI